MNHESNPSTQNQVLEDEKTKIVYLAELRSNKEQSKKHLYIICVFKQKNTTQFQIKVNEKCIIFRIQEEEMCQALIVDLYRLVDARR